MVLIILTEVIRGHVALDDIHYSHFLFVLKDISVTLESSDSYQISVLCAPVYGVRPIPFVYEVLPYYDRVSAALIQKHLFPAYFLRNGFTYH